jgi:hypothetical protein
MKMSALRNHRVFHGFFTVTLAVMLLAGVLVVQAAAAKSTNSGTTLAGYKTLDICAVDDNTWRFSGVISVWNEGAIATVGFTINDFIENKTGTKFVKDYDVFVNAMPGEIPAGTTQTTALTFPYSIDAAPLAGTIRNNASMTILNHSSSIGKPFGPNAKATYTGTIPPPPCNEEKGCTFTQGYWGNKPDVVWPDGFDRNATFLLSGQTWQQVLDTPVNVSQGYYQLAHQFIAAVLNQANGASVPQGVQDTLNLADAWLDANGPSACTANGSCGTQKDWAATLDLYNNGLYPDGPPHCAE